MFAGILLFGLETKEFMTSGVLWDKLIFFYINSAGTMCAMAEQISSESDAWISWTVGSMNIINDTIVIIINSIVGNFSRIGPHNILEIWVIKIYSCVNDCNNYFFGILSIVSGTQIFFPAFLSIDICMIV